MSDSLGLNEFQRRLCLVPEDVDVFCGGSRGGGKSFGLALLALRHAEQHGDRARILYLRRTYKGLADWELVTREVFTLAYGQSARYNGSEHTWRLPTGAYVELGQLESAAEYGKYQGRSVTLLLIDEAGQYPSPDLLDLMRSNLRGKDVPIRVVMAGNPAGPGHHWLASRYVFRAAPWQPFFEEKSKRTWVYAPSTYRGNDFLDVDSYGDQLASACPDDPELLRAWRDGDWSVNRGAYFANVLDESRNAVAPWSSIPLGWRTWLAHDFGSTAPSCTHLFVESPGATHRGKFFPRGSLIIVDELAAVRRGNLNMGLGWTASTTAEAIREMCVRWNVPPKGVADDACFAKHGHGSGSIADEFARGGVRFRPAQKAGRIAGWQVMRRLLADAGKVDRPGLYVSRAARYFWATVPTLARDEKRVDDVSSDGPDHAADCARYGCLRREQHNTVSPLKAW